MKRFLLISNQTKDKDLHVTRRVIDTLRERGCVVYLAEPYAARVGSGVTPLAADALPSDAEAVLTIGGDGTVLDASRTALRLGLPLLGVNLGRRGYLAELEPEQIPLLTRLCEDEYHIRELMTLSVSLFKGEREWQLPRLTVNDVVFHRQSSDHALTLSLSCEGGSEIHYLADGLILSTPCGSTAYSLSAGGPILSPSIPALCATPICPHSFFNRPILFDSTDTLCVKNSSATQRVLLTLDGRENILMDPGDYVHITESKTRFRLLSLEKCDFLGILHKKMKMTE